MDRITKKHLFYWVNIAFLILNTAFFVFLFLSRCDRNVMEDSSISNDFLRKELKLTNEQCERIVAMDSMVQRRYQKVLLLLCQERYKMMEELAKPDPSEEKLHSISVTIGHLHQALKVQTFRHLLNIKRICTPEQSKKLNKIFTDMLEINKYCEGCERKCSAEEKQKRLHTIRHYSESGSVTSSSVDLLDIPIK